MFALEQIDLYQSAQFGFLGMSAGNVLGQLEPAVTVYFCSSSEVRDGGVCDWLRKGREDCWADSLPK